MATPSDKPANLRNQATFQGFTETRWSQVACASKRESADSQAALASLCESYLHPIYSFLRRKGHAPHDAEDLTQQFFVRLLSKDTLSNADQGKGRFRSFLLGALKHFEIDAYRKATAQKRGGPQTLLPIDLEDAEERYRQEPDDAKMAVYRMRQRYRQLVRAEVMETLADSHELEDELGHLFGGS